MATITACGRVGSKCAMPWNITSALRGRTYTTKLQNYSDATVSFSALEIIHAPNGIDWKAFFIYREHMPILKAVVDLTGSALTGSDNGRAIWIRQVQIEERHKVVYKLDNANLSPSEIKIYLNNYCQGGLDYLRDDMGTKYPDQSNE